MRNPALIAMVLAVAAPLAVAGESSVPPSLAVPAGERLVMMARAKGVQIYSCGASAKDPAALEWTLKAPEALLIDDKGKPLGKHYAGPTWEANDGSKVMGEVVARVAKAGTIPWLLLRAKVQGKGVFDGVTSIQRLDTVGGAAPASGCDDAHRGVEQRVPYSARYVFFGK